MANKFDFKQAAQESTLLCKLMQNREKLDTQDVVGKELTIMGFDFAPKFDQQGNRLADENGEQDVFGVVIFKEIDGYYCVGTVFTKVCKVWATAYDGDADAASADLARSGGVHVRFSEGKTKRGNNLVNVEIL